jgi:hypothetical protein
MSIAPEPEVRLDNHTLWIGGDAYPLHTITRVTTSEHGPDRPTAVRHYAIVATSWLFPATIASTMTPKPVSALITLTALTWFTLRTTSLIRYLRTPQHELVIETTTGRHRALTSTDPTPVEKAALQIMDALQHPPTSLNQT